MELADSGDLIQKIAMMRKNCATLLEHDIWRIFIQAVRGLRALHNLGILHRDIKVKCCSHIVREHISIQGLYCQTR